MNDTTAVAKPLSVKTTHMPGVVIVVLDAEVIARADGILARIDAVHEVTDDNLEDSDEIAREAATLLKEIEAARKKAKAPVLALGRALDNAPKAIVGRLEAGRRRIDDGILARKRARERALLEAEAARRKAEEETRQREAAIAELESAAVTTEDRLAVNELRVESRSEGAKAWAESIQAEPEHMPSVGVHERTDTTVEIFDLPALPCVVQGVQIAEPKLPAIKKLLQAGIEVPGARLVERSVMVRR